MSAGSSAPELSTALIGVFVAKDDIGVSGVVGSAVFNITLVIAVCSLVTPRPLHLHWYPVIRSALKLHVVRLRVAIYLSIDLSL